MLVVERDSQLSQRKRKRDHQAGYIPCTAVTSMYIHNGERKWLVTFVLFAYVRTYIHESPRVVFGEDKAGWIV